MSDHSAKLSPWLEFKNRLWFEMKDHGELSYVTPGEQLLLSQQGCMFFLVEGELVVFVVDEQGNQKLLMVLGEGALLGEGQLFTQFSADLIVKAYKPAVLRAFSQQIVLQLIRNNPELVGEIVRSMLSKMDLILEQIEELAFCSAEERLINTLSRLESKPSQSWPRYEKDSGPSHQELAEMIGIHRVTVSRLMADLRKEALLSIGES